MTVVFKKGNYATLPTSAQVDELLFVLDIGKIYKGTGTGLTSFSDVLFGYADLADLQSKVSNGIDGKLHLTDDNKLYRSKNGTFELVSASDSMDSFDAIDVNFDNTSTTLTSENVQDVIIELNSKINATTNGMTYGGTVNTYADLATVTTPINGMLVVVLADENNDGGRGAYIYNDTASAWDYFGTFEMTEEFTSLSDTPNAHVADKFVMSDGTKLVFTDLDYDKLINKPTSTIAQIDQAVTDSHTHANKLQLDKISEDVDGNPLYDGQPFGGSTLEWEDWNI